MPRSVDLKLYRTGLFTSEPYSDNFRQFQANRGQPIEPVAALESLPGLPKEAEATLLENSLLGKWTDLIQNADKELASPQVRPLDWQSDAVRCSVERLIVGLLCRSGRRHKILRRAGRREMPIWRAHSLMAASRWHAIS